MEAEETESARCEIEGEEALPDWSFAEAGLIYIVCWVPFAMVVVATVYVNRFDLARLAEDVLLLGLLWLTVQVGRRRL